MNEFPDHSRRFSILLLLFVTTGFVIAFLYGIRSVLVAPVVYVALLAILWQYRERAEIVTILQVITGVFLVYVVVKLKSLVPVFIISMLLLVLLRDPVEWLVKKHVRRGLAVLLIMAGAFAILTALIAMIVPAIAEESQRFVLLLPTYYDRIQAKVVNDWIPYLQTLPIFSSVDFSIWKEKLPQLAQRALQTIAHTGGTLAEKTGNTISQIINLFLIPVIVLYMLLDERTVVDRALHFVSPEKAKPWRKRLKHVSRILNRWLRGQIIVSVCDGIMIGIGLEIIGVNYALMIGVLTIFLSFIPYIGLITSFGISVLLALSGGGGMGTIVGVIIVFIVAQVIEGYVISPKVMGKAVGLSDLTTVIVLAIGAELFGLVGMVFAVPVTAIAVVLIREWWSAQHGVEANEHEE